MADSFHEFVAAAQAQGTVLESRLLDCEQWDPRFMYAPTLALKAVALAGSLLRYQPSLRLVENDASLRLDALPSDTPSQVLGAIINASLVPMRERRAAAVGLDFEGHEQGLGACDTAEHGFVKALRGMRFFAQHGYPLENRWRGSYDVRLVMHEATGVPALVQKATLGIRTAVTLEDTCIDGIPYPPGSIVLPRFTSERLDGSIEGVESVSTQDVDRLSFMRLSSFALQPDERIVAPVLPEDEVKYGITVTEIAAIGVGHIAQSAAEVAHRLRETGMMSG